MTEQEIYDYFTKYPPEIVRYNITESGHISLEINLHYNQWPQALKNDIHEGVLNIGYNGNRRGNGWKSNLQAWHSRNNLYYEINHNILPRHFFCNDQEQKLDPQTLMYNPSLCTSWRLLPIPIDRFDPTNNIITLELDDIAIDPINGYHFTDNMTLNQWQEYRRQFDWYIPYFRFSMNIVLRFMSTTFYYDENTGNESLGECVKATIHFPPFIWEYNNNTNQWVYWEKGQNITYN